MTHFFNKNIDMESTTTLGNNLAEIMNKVDKPANWSRWLGLTRSAVSQWFSGKVKPKPENLQHVRDILKDEDKEGTYEEFQKLCDTNLVHLTEDYKKYKAYNLYEYIAKVELEQIDTDLRMVVMPSSEKEDFYKQIRLFVRLLGELDKETREKFKEITNALENKLSSSNPNEINTEVKSKIDEIHRFLAVGNQADNLPVSKSKRKKPTPLPIAENGVRVKRPSTTIKRKSK